MANCTRTLRAKKAKNYAKMHVQGLDEDMADSEIEDGQIVERDSPFRVMVSDDEFRAEDISTEATPISESRY